MSTVSFVLNASARRTLVIASAIAGTVLGSTAAHAGSRGPVRDPKVVITHVENRLPVVEYGHGHDHGRGHDHCGPSRITQADRDYAEGVRAGRCAGFDEGYADGLKGRHYDDCVKLDACTSRHYREGFAWAYGNAYARGYEQGKCERPCDKPGRGWNVRIRW